MARILLTAMPGLPIRVAETAQRYLRRIALHHAALARQHAALRDEWRSTAARAAINAARVESALVESALVAHTGAVDSFAVDSPTTSDPAPDRPEPDLAGSPPPAQLALGV